jgi:WhiB family redox-sensing transcriptional regulator
MKRDWRDDAACAGMDTELWFPVSAFPKGAELQRVRRAQEVCGPCPVRISCLAFALRTGQRGIWGGLTEQQRRRSKLCKSLRAESLAS